MGAQANRRTSEEKGPFPPLSGIPRCRLGAPKMGEKGRFRLIFRKGGETSLKPPFVNTPICGSPKKSEAGIERKESGTKTKEEHIEKVQNAALR